MQSKLLFLLDIQACSKIYIRVAKSILKSVKRGFTLLKFNYFSAPLTKIL